MNASVAVPHGGHWWFRLLAFLGPGYMVSVGYMDPGNWATDIAGGAQFGYLLLSVILLSNLMAIVLQGCRPGSASPPGATWPRPAATTTRAQSPWACGCSAKSRSSPAIWPR